MENRKGIKQIGLYSFLYSNANEIIYNISLSQSESSIYVRFIKMRMTSVFMYEGKALKEEMMKVIVNSKGSDGIMKEMGVMVFNQNFTIKEEKECIRMTMMFGRDENNKERIKVMELNEVSNDKGDGNDYISIIQRLSKTIEKQNVTINQLEKNEGELLNRISNLEKINRLMSDNIVQFKQKLNQPIQQPSLSHPYPLFQPSSKQNTILNSAPAKIYKNSTVPVNPYLPQFQIDNTQPFDFNLQFNNYSPLIQSKEELEIIYKWISPFHKIKLSLLYKGTKCNFSPKQFHLNCNQASSTLTIIQSITGNRFGGYTTQSWEGDELYKTDYNAFLFSLDTLTKFPIKPEAAEYAIYCRPNNLVVFGNGYDICILDQSKNYQSLSQFPISYGTGKDSQWSLTNGLKSFSITEIETYQVEL